MINSDYTPQRGDLVWLSFNPQAGHEQSGRRPAVILSPVEYNRKVSLAVLCPVTSKTKGYPFEVKIPDGLPIHGVILSDQVKSLDWRIRKAEFVSRLPCSVMEELTSKLSALILLDAQI